MWGEITVVGRETWKNQNLNKDKDGGRLCQEKGKPEAIWRVLPGAVGNKSGKREMETGQTENVACSGWLGTEDQGSAKGLGTLLHRELCPHPPASASIRLEQEGRTPAWGGCCSAVSKARPRIAGYLASISD